MEETLAAAVILGGVAFNSALLWWIGVCIFILLLIGAILKRRSIRKPHISRAEENPILSPQSEHPWENEAVFNPAAVCADGRVHLLYRALGSDGVSRIGYASSADGIHFDERLPYPVFTPELGAISKFKNPFTSPARLAYNPALYASGGGWGGSEDPRAVLIDGRVYMSYSAFNGWQSVRMMLASMDEDNFLAHRFAWSTPVFLSPPNQIHKNWVLFPEKIHGSYAILHSIYPKIEVAYRNSIETLGVEESYIESWEGQRYAHERKGEGWDSKMRGAGPPPIKTPHGWLLFYHANDARESHRFKVGAMLLDLQDPTKILYRSAAPILAPDMPYENDWKPGIVYSCGAVVKDGTLFLYYGGGDKTVNVAHAPLEQFLRQLMKGEHVELSRAV